MKGESRSRGPSRHLCEQSIARQGVRPESPPETDENLNGRPPGRAESAVKADRQTTPGIVEASHDPVVEPVDANGPGCADMSLGAPLRLNKIYLSSLMMLPTQRHPRRREDRRSATRLAPQPRQARDIVT